MMDRRNILYALFVFLLIAGSKQTKAQNANVITHTIIPQSSQPVEADTVPIITVSSSELDKITNIKALLNRQNNAFSIPYQPNNELLRFIQKDEVSLSDEAMYWVTYVRDISQQFGDDVTFKDTVIADPMFMPMLFKSDYMPKNFTFYNTNLLNTQNPYSKLFTLDSSLFKNEIAKQEIREMAYQYIAKNHPDYFRYSTKDLPTNIPNAKEIIRSNPFAELFNVTNEADFSSVNAPEKFTPKVKHWIPYFESLIQFSQNYISPNWHKGGNGNVNLYTRNYFRYNYNKGKVQFVNELEWKAGFYNAPKDTLHSYRIGDDVFRIHSNIGYKAFSNWYYTFDGEFKTQMFSNYAENSTKKLAALLSPMSINIGIGMKYDLRKEQFKDKHRKLYFSTNIAPLSLLYMYSLNKEIDLNRHGFKDGKNYLNNIGSSVRADLTFNINRNVSWQSRLNYFTSYKRIEVEFENTLSLAISRFFSTRINMNLRFDDGITKKEEFDSYLQVYELLSFGFNYKW